MREGQKTSSARRLRQDATVAEQILWQRLRNHSLAGLKFRRQVPLGPYIVDFLCFDHRLVVEADGSQHVESMGDLVRDAFLEGKGFRILRFWNNDILTRLDLVCDTIHLAAHSPHPDLPPQAGEVADQED